MEGKVESSLRKNVIRVLNMLVGYPVDQENKLLGRFADYIIDIVKDEKESYEKNLNIPLADVKLSVRATNLMRNMNIKTIGELMQHTKTSLLKTKMLGRKTLSEIEDVLKEYDLELKDR
jgi:DNA-directed RNA polymerase alpha subunit